LRKDNIEKEWYDDPSLITTILIGLIVIILIMSQSYAIRNHYGFLYVVRALLNYSSVYLMYLIYLIFLKTKVGKKYFNMMNLIASFVFVLLTLASILTVIQFPSVGSMVNAVQSLLLSVYFTYVFLEDSKIYEQLGLKKLQFSTVSNDQYFYILLGLIGVGLIVSLIQMVDFTGVVLTLLESIFMVGFVRYIYLYQSYKEAKCEEVQEQKEQTAKIKAEEKKNKKKEKEEQREQKRLEKEGKKSISKKNIESENKEEGE